MELSSQAAILIAAGFATIGWIYTARRARNLSRKQHTVNVLMQATINREFRNSLDSLAKAMRNSPCPDLRLPEHEELACNFRQVANFYEFIAAGLRNGDFDERLVRDTARNTMLNTFEKCQGFIWSLRNARRNQTIYEHVEWLYTRWEKKPPGKLQALCEWATGRPFSGTRVNPHA